MASPEPEIDLGDESLFGNEAAEDEDESIFRSYAYERPEVGRFCDPKKPIQLVRAYKGEGKSALLRLARARISTSDPAGVLVLDTTGPALSPDLDTNNFDKWVRGWKQSLLGLAANEVGSRIGMAWTDDSMALVETSERNGFRNRSFVSAIVDRLTSGVGPVERKRIPTFNPEAVLKRWKGTPPAIWFFIDDLDRNFEHTPDTIAKLSALFDACRQIVNSVPAIRFRLAIRPNTWTSLKLKSEALSHMEQYTSVLTWSEHEILELLGRRVEGYLTRTGQIGRLEGYIPAKGPERSKALLTFAFESPITWGDGSRPIHVPLYTLSQHRPRWLIELCRLSARRANDCEHSKIQPADIFAELPRFGKRRLEDTVAEFRPQCPEIGEILDAFRGQSEQYHTDELLTLLENRVTNHINARIVGVSERPSHRQVGSFLFEIGFLFARRDYTDGKYEHISYTDQPSLLLSRTDLDSGLSWEIPPVFRQALDLRTPEGFKRPQIDKNKKPPRRRRLVRPTER